MDVINIVPSLSRCLELAKYWPEDLSTVFSRRFVDGDIDTSEVRYTLSIENYKNSSWKKDGFCAAPTVGEIIDALPLSLDLNEYTYHLEIHTGAVGYYPEYDHLGPAYVVHIVGEHNIIDVLSQLYLLLAEKGEL